MGGHAAWRKRVAAGGLAKDSGGAALRHRPRLGRRGVELALNRKGNLGGHGNPKRKAKKKKSTFTVNERNVEPGKYSFMNLLMKMIEGLVLLVVILMAVFLILQLKVPAVHISL